MDDRLWTWSAAALAQAVREKRVSCREVVEAHLERIGAVNGALNAITVVLADEAMAAARAADEAVARGEALGPLHGVPMTVKENVDVAGSATTQGVVALEKLDAPVDAPHIAQLRSAGAIPIARTNLPDFGLRWHTDNELRGATRNPWDPDRTPGGSSGGDAAALAAGMTPLGNGNDYGGSLRIPAQFCGIASLRTTLGRVAQHMALAPSEPAPTVQLYAVQGPMARHVGDLRTAFAAMSGPDPRDPWWTPAPLEGPPPPAPIRVAVVTDPGGQGVHPHVAEGVRRAADALADAGYAVEELEPPALDEANDLWRRTVIEDVRRSLAPVIRPLVSKGAAAFLDVMLAAEPELDAAGYIATLAARQGVARQWTAFHAEVPLILGPVSTQPAFPIGHDIASPVSSEEVLRSMRFVTPVNLLGLPAAALPVGVTEGLPMGIQIIGDRFREDLCLDAAEAIEARLGTLTPLDPA